MDVRGGDRRDDVRSYPAPTVEDTCVEIDGELYGARPDDRGPFGGGDGYAGIVTGGDYCVRNTFELIDALGRAQPGQVVFVEPEAEIDFTSRVAGDEFVLELPGGVTLASNRGQDGAPGAMLYCDAFKAQPFLRVTGPEARITGLRICGPDPRRRDEWDYRCFGPEALGNPHYYRFAVSQGVSCDFDALEVDNCQFSGWSHAAVLLRDGKGHRVHHNWMHHNQRQALGYHVSHNLTAESLIEYNLFDYARHAIAGSGKSGSGYEARHNVVLPNANGHAFDMHGGADRKDGTDIAGEWMHVHHNTFMLTYDEVNRPAISVRGVPRREALVEYNWFYHCRPGEETVRHRQRTRVAKNLYGRPPRSWWVVAHVAWDAAPSADPQDPPGRLALTLTNLGGNAANVYCPTIPLHPEEDVGVKLPRQTTRLAPGETRRIDLPVHYLGRFGWGAVEVAFDRWAGGLPLLTDSDRVATAVLGRRLAVVDRLDDVRDVDGAVARGQAARFTANGEVLAEVQFVVAGDALALRAKVRDRDILRTPEVWTGSCVEVFAARQAGPIEQALVVPASPGRPAEGFRAGRHDIEPAPDVQAVSEACEGGYILRAIVPLRCLAQASVREALNLEFQVSFAPAPGAERRHVTLFGAKKPFEISLGYARFELAART